MYEVLHFSNCPVSLLWTIVLCHKYTYPTDCLQHLVSQIPTEVSVSGSATQAGTKLATAAFKAAPTGLRWTLDACNVATGAAPASAESGPLAAFGGVASLAGMNRLRDSTPRACEETRWCTLQASKHQNWPDPCKMWLKKAQRGSLQPMLNSKPLKAR